MTNFVVDAKNSRDFQPDIDIEVIGIAEMNKMELRIECKHKSNWANETIRAARRSKFMCALVLALRRVPIYGPGGGDAALGSLGQPSFSVSVSAEEADYNRDQFAAKKEAKRLNPTKKADEGADIGSTTATDYSGQTANELRALQTLNARSPAVDRGRDDAWSGRDDVSIHTIEERERASERASLDEVRGLLSRESSKGRRHPGVAFSNNSLPVIEEPLSPARTPPPQMYPMTSLSLNTQYVPPPGPIGPAGNAFAQPVQRRDVPQSSNAYSTPPAAPPKGSQGPY